MSYLNKEGLQYFLQKIKEKIDSSRRPKPNWDAPEESEASILGRTHYANLTKIVNYEITSNSYDYKDILYFHGDLNTAFRIYIPKLAQSFTLSRFRTTIVVNVYNRTLTFNWRNEGSAVVLKLTAPSSGEKTKIEIEAIDVAKKLHSGYIDNDIARTYQLAEIQNKIAELSEEIASNGVLIDDLQNMKINKENDDYYPNMAVGLADNLAGVDVVDSEINFRRSGGGAISDGVARIESIKGNSVVWNQLATFQGTNTTNGITFTTNADGSITISGTATGNAYFAISDNNIYLANHKIAMYGSVANVGIMFGNNIITSNVGMDYIFSKSDSFENSAFLYVKDGTTFDSAVIIRPRITDLTKMFQAGNEPTTIEEFYARIPMGVDLNAYNEGEVIHMDVQSIESVGVNAWDEEWELGSISTNTGANVDRSTIIRTKNFIPVIEGQKYYYSCPSTASAWSFCYDAKYNVVEKYLSNNKTGLASTLYNAEVTIPQGVHYIKFYVVDTYGTTYNHDICINLSDPSINGKYFPHIKRVEDLSLIHKYFPDGMKSAGTAHDEIRNNTATGKRESKDALLAVKMKDLDWNGSTSANYTHAFRAALGIGEASGNNVMCIRFVRASNTPISAWITDRNPYTIAYYNGHIGVNDPAFTDVNAFIASLTDNDILYIERAEPIITELDAEDQYKDLDYQVWNGGTERAIAEGKSSPLAADITYGFNAIGKIKELEEAIKALQTTVASM